MKTDYTNEYIKARNMYYLIGFLMCPSLGNKLIYFNSDGFRHFTKKGKTRRTEYEQMRRFRLIPYIRRVITSNETVVEEHRVILKTEYTSLIYMVDSKYYIKIVVRKVLDGRISFVSIMDIQK